MDHRVTHDISTRDTQEDKLPIRQLGGSKNTLRNKGTLREKTQNKGIP